ncbi:unnamed protein product [Heligmosomoides polygyrus]|uniref:Uncharacterized protein n=1 Tax=Heligmosomoides polygyrus TaxID=6339 RepID=A0A183GH77_HELPZ|nr:unnamed protein product [Heligmosomoides polygyrus]
MVDGLMMRSEHLFHEVMVTRKRMLDEEEKKKLPQHCRGGLSSKNLTCQWMLEECKPFKGRDLRKMLESFCWLQLGDTDKDREEAFREMQNARVDWSALIRKTLSPALTEVRTYSFVAPGLPLAPKGNKKVVTLPS